MPPRILCVEDEAEVLEGLSAFFEREGFDVLAARSGDDALALAAQRPPHVAVLDVMLHEGPGGPDGMDGFDTCRGLRAQGFDGPIIFLTARTMEQDKLLGFELGADDYMTKPFSLLELHARVRALLRRSGGVRSVFTYGDVVVDLDSYVVKHEDGDERLSNREQELLRFLIENKGRVLPRDLLLTSIWHYSPRVTTRTVDTHILNLRKKLRDDASNPQFIETLHAVGYRFIAEES